MKQMNTTNFDQIRDNPLSIPEDMTIVTMVHNKKPPKINLVCSYPNKVSAHLEEFLVQEFEQFGYNHLFLMAKFLPGNFFGSVQAKVIVAHICLIT
jgi:hypothetical protein